jgi:hypothetical protein
LPHYGHINDAGRGMFDASTIIVALIEDDVAQRLSRIEHLLHELRVQTDAAHEEAKVASESMATRSDEAKRSSAAAQARADARRAQTRNRTRRP